MYPSALAFTYVASTTPNKNTPYARLGFEGEKARAPLESEIRPEARVSDNGAPGEEPKPTSNVVVLADGVGAAARPV